MRFPIQLKNFFLKNNLLVTFFLRLAVIYLIWLLAYDMRLVDSTPLDQFLIQNLIDTCVVVMELMGFEMFESASRYVGIQYSSGVEIGPPCNAFSLFVLYGAIVLAFPGQWKLKTIFIVIGVLVIHLLNIIRVIALVYLAKFKPEALAFNHSYTFTLIVYACIFLMWMYWIKRYSRVKSKQVE